MISVLNLEIFIQKSKTRGLGVPVFEAMVQGIFLGQSYWYFR